MTITKSTLHIEMNGNANNWCQRLKKKAFTWFLKGQQLCTVNCKYKKHNQKRENELQCSTFIYPLKGVDN